MKLVYIVIATKNEDSRWYIDSLWSSHRKARKRQQELNQNDKNDWRSDYGFGLFEIEQKFISTN